MLHISDGVYKEVELMLLHLFRQLKPVQSPKGLLSTFSVDSMNFTKSVELRVVLMVCIIWWHTTGFSASGNMEGIDKKLHPPIEPLGKVGTLFQIAQKWVQVTYPIVPKVMQSVNVLPSTKGHNEKQVNLSG